VTPAAPSGSAFRRWSRHHPPAPSDGDRSAAAFGRQSRRCPAAADATVLIAESDAEGEGTFFLVHKVDGGWIAVASTDKAGWTADELKQLGAPADLAFE